MTPEARRIYSTNYARRRRERKLELQRLTAHRCPKKYGPGLCGCVLRVGTDKIGRTIIICDWCDRKKAGLCRHCSRPPYAPRAVYCTEHKHQVQRQQQAKSGLRHHDKRLEQAKARYRAFDPERRRRHLEYKRQWRKAHPDKVREQKQRYVARKTPRYVEYHRRYNAMAKRAERKREMAKAAYYNANPVRPDPHCQRCGNSITWTPLPGGVAGSPPKNCDGCCTKSEYKRRLAVRARRAERSEVERLYPKPVARPLRVKKPQPYRFARSGQRLCLTPGCDIVVTHKRKKCTKCRRREVEDAQHVIAAVHGRGRRTDLEKRSA